MNRKFSPERLFKIRRLRKARRLWKAAPLFAFQQMQQRYAGYDNQTFIDDLRRRTKPKRRMKKTTMNRFGRYYRIDTLIRKYNQTGNVAFALQAISMQKRLTKPYRLAVQLDGQCTEYLLSALIPIQKIEELTEALKSCKTWPQAEALIQKTRSDIN